MADRWHVAERSETLRVATIHDENGLTVATCGLEDAELVAAAPTLLAQLRNLARSLDAIANGEWDEVPQDRARHCRELATDTLALVWELEKEDDDEER